MLNHQEVAQRALSIIDENGSVLDAMKSLIENGYNVAASLNNESCVGIGTHCVGMYDTKNSTTISVTGYSNSFEQAFMHAVWHLNHASYDRFSCVYPDGKAIMGKDWLQVAPNGDVLFIH